MHFRNLALCLIIIGCSFSLAVLPAADSFSADLTLTGTNANGQTAGIDAVDTRTGDLSVSDGIQVGGGKGGDFFLGSNLTGGSGGSATLSVGGNLSANQNISLTGGNGGDLNQSGGGNNRVAGQGGDATVNVTGSLTSSGNLSLIGGNSGSLTGNLGNNNITGNGGSAFLNAGSVFIGGTLTLQSGMRTPVSWNTSGNGGDVSFTADFLDAGTITLNGPANAGDGDLYFDVGMLLVTRDTGLNLDSTLAADVNLGGLLFANGSELSVTQSNGGLMTAGGELVVLGADNSYDSPIAFDASDMYFSLDGAASGSTLLTAVDQPIQTAGASVTLLPLPGGGPDLPAGYAVTLIDGATGAPDVPGGTVRMAQGIARLYDFAVEYDGGASILSTSLRNGPYNNPQLKSLLEGRAAGQAFLGWGSDLIVGPGLRAARHVTEGAQGRLVPFVTGMGGTSRYDTGSHVDVDGFTMMAGLAWQQPLDAGRNGSLLLGAFFEGGWGGYDSHNSFSNLPSVKGDGDISYYGGGIMARYETAPLGPGRLYLDASFRAGQIDTDFSSNDFFGYDSNGDYDSSSAYYGAHAGIGYAWSITERATLDFSTRYIWTHQDSDSVHIQGDRIKFDEIDSHRWRSGAQFSYAVNDYITPYLGAYYDHEFDGEAKGSTYGRSIDSPDLKGGTGVGELGISIRPFAGKADASSGLSLDLGVQGYTGVREGVTGSFQVKWEF